MIDRNPPSDKRLRNAVEAAASELSVPGYGFIIMVALGNGRWTWVSKGADRAAIADALEEAAANYPEIYPIEAKR